jgi:hypothetical protein
MNISEKQLRNILRITHLVAGVVLGNFLYSPLGSNPTFRMLMQIVIFPVFVLTGLWLWQMPRVRKLLKSK